LYRFGPNVRVEGRDALIGGIAAAAMFELTKYGFTIFISKVPIYKTLYGAFAIGPFFLVWIYLTWWVTLLWGSFNCKFAANSSGLVSRKRPVNSLAIKRMSTDTKSKNRLKKTNAKEMQMKVSDILRVKGNTLYTISPDTNVLTAVHIMAENDIGSLVVMQYGELVGILTFREVIGTLAHSHGIIDSIKVGTVMDESPLICTPETELDEVRRMMLNRHARYLPVMENRNAHGRYLFL
jgi:CBS domain-containing protein